MINKKELLVSLQSDYKASEVHQKEWIARRDKWVDETYGNKGYGNEQKGRSSIVSKDIKRQLEWLIPSMVDPFLGTPDVIKCNPVTAEDVESARQNELVLNTQFTRKFDRYNFITRAARVLATEGTCIVQTGWDYQDERVKEEVDVIAINPMTGKHEVAKTEVESTKVIVNKPTAHVCRNEDVFVDPTCMGDMDKAQFVIYRYETDLSTLRKDGRYKNLKHVGMKLASEDTDYIPEDRSNFEFRDDPRKKFVVYEYWGNYDMKGDGIAIPIVCVWTEHNVIIRLEDNPYPDKKPPFLVVPFTPIPFQLEGEALAENIGDRQKVKTAITRGIIDNMARSNNGQVGLRKGALSPADKKKFLAGKNFEFNGTPGDFWQGSFNQIPGSVFNVLQMMDNDIESQTGVKSFNQGISGNSLGSSATGVRASMDATGMRKLNLVRNMAENLLKPLMRKWMAYNAEFLDEEEVVRVTNSEFVPIRRDDLQGRIDIDIAISTAEDNNAKAQQLSFLMQTIGNSMGQELMQIIISDIARLQKMPDLADKIANYKPQPDPMAQQEKQLELQKMQAIVGKLQAEIEDIRSRGQENEGDLRLKNAKAMVEEAKAEKLASDKDMTDLKFIKENEGVDHAQKLELEELKAKMNLLSMQMQQKAGDKNLGIYEG